MSTTQCLELSPADLRPGDMLPYWDQRVVASISRGDFGQVLIWAEGKAPLALSPSLRITAYRERAA